MSPAEEARRAGLAWEKLSNPKPQLTLEIYTPRGLAEVYYLDPHAPHLTPKSCAAGQFLWESGAGHGGRGSKPLPALVAYKFPPSIVVWDWKVFPRPDPPCALLRPETSLSKSPEQWLTTGDSAQRGEFRPRRPLLRPQPVLRISRIFLRGRALG